MARSINKASVKGELVARIIAPKRGAIGGDHEDIVALEFKVEGGDTIQLYVQEASNARQIFDVMRQLMARKPEGEVQWVIPMILPKAI